VIILSETAKMSLADNGVIPGMSLTKRLSSGVTLPFAVLHLTKGSGAIIAGHAVQGAGAGAVDFSASVDAIKEKGDSTTDWEFNFIQLLYQPIQKFHYAGFTKSDGSMVLDVTEPIPQYRLDSDAARAPFPVTKAATATVLPQTAAKRPRDVRDAPPDIRFGNNFEDHPNVSNLFLVNKNYKTGADNYLIQAQVHRHFFTAFVARDKLKRRSSDYIPLAYITWRTIWEGTVYWMTKSNKATVILTKKEYKADPVTTTYPSAPYAKLIEAPTNKSSEMFSEINFTNFKNAFNATADNRNCMASADWPQAVSPNMWAT
jgi:hypothetical protein